VLEELERIQNETLQSLSGVKTEKEVSEIRLRILGKKGSLTQLLKRLGILPEEDRKEIGRRANRHPYFLETLPCVLYTWSTTK